MKLHPHDGVGVKNTLHHALGPFLVLAQFFGVLPVYGVWPTSNVAHVKFYWCTPAVLVTLLLICYSAFDLFVSGKVVIERGLKLYTAGPLTFSLICLVGYNIFLHVSQSWPHLIKQTRQIEVVFLQKPYANKESKHFSRTIRGYGILFLIGAVIEHMSYVGSALYSNHLQIARCNLTVNFWENFFMRERLQIFSHIPFNMWLIPLVEWITIAMTFTWNFVDIFLILNCVGLAMRFNQLRWRIEQHLSQQMPGEFWADVRKDLMSLTDLMQQMDKKLSGLILLSCTHNLYFICVQVFYSFTPKANFMNELYFWLSLIFVLTRILTMMFSAASVHDAANNILSIMYEIPTAYWCLELKRLNEIIASDMIALSGRQFFFMTRRLIFAMAGTIVIYELVLLDQVDDASDNSAGYCLLRRKI